MGKPSYKWVPVVTDFCIGCGKCIETCPHSSLKSVWDFATLERPDTCTSAADCISVCEDDAIHMRWVAVGGSSGVGEWTDEPPPGPVKKGMVATLANLFGG